MDKEERKTINQGQEDEMVTSFYNLLIKYKEFISAINYSRKVQKYIKKPSYINVVSSSCVSNWDYVNICLFVNSYFTCELLEFRGKRYVFFYLVI